MKLTPLERSVLVDIAGGAPVYRRELHAFEQTQRAAAVTRLKYKRALARDLTPTKAGRDALAASLVVKLSKDEHEALRSIVRGVDPRYSTSVGVGWAFRAVSKLVRRGLLRGGVSGGLTDVGLASLKAAGDGAEQS